MSSILKLMPSETVLCGSWLNGNDVLIADEVCSRIAYLLEHELRQVAVDDSGWASLYVDPADGRFWELSFPKSEMHGGGPPMLTCIGGGEAASRYQLPPPPTA